MEDAAAPAVGDRIVDFEFSLAAEPADHVDFPAHLGHRHLGPCRGHRERRWSTADTLGKGRSSEQGTAEEQRCSEGFEPGLSVSSRLGVGDQPVPVPSKQSTGRPEAPHKQFAKGLPRSSRR